MSETIVITATDRKGVYTELLPQVRSLIDNEPDLIANLANITSALKLALPYASWVGFYLLRDRDLVLGPFQGKPACVRIAPGKGVCGTAYVRRETIIVPDVEAFPGHIACDAGSRSEIVVPLIGTSICHGVLDVDSYALNAFDETDRVFLEQIAAMTIPFFERA